MTATVDAVPARTRPPILLAALLLILGLGAGFGVVRGVLPILGGAGGQSAASDAHPAADTQETATAAHAAPTGETASGHGVATDGHATPSGPVFVPLAPILVMLPPGSGPHHLRFVAQLDVEPAHADEVSVITPRIIDAFNAYLRAVEVNELQDPAALLRLRSQLLRRAQVIAGVGMVNDLLVMEFVLN